MEMNGRNRSDEEKSMRKMRKIEQKMRKIDQNRRGE